MIEFKGEITGNCKQYIMKRETVISCFGFIVGAGAISIPIIILSITCNAYIWLMMLLPAATVIAGFIPFFLKDYGLSKVKLLFPTTISIDDEGEMTCENEEFHEYRHISQVKKVFDMGEWYAIYFYWPHRTIRYVCQKDLLCQGTLEEFEKLFQEKLVVKK